MIDAQPRVEDHLGMRNYSLGLSSLVLLFLCGSMGFAAEPAVVGQEKTSTVLNDPEIKDWIYFGTDLGYAKLSTSNLIRESDKSGYQLNFKILYSHYFAGAFEDWVMDLGIGYFYNNISGKDRYSTLTNPEVKVITRAGFLEFSPRYRLTDHWQLGVVVNGLMGEDVSFNESTTRQENAFSVLVGPRVNYEWPSGIGRWRVGFQVMTDLTIANRQLWLFQGDIQYGIPFGEEARPEVVSTPVPAFQPPPRPQAPKFAEITEGNGVKIYLGEAVLRFKTAKWDLRPSSREILAKVAKYLKKYQGAWKKMRVEGHTDKRGKLAFNETLARKRATSVKRELGTLGVPTQKMIAKGFGPSKPIDPAEDVEAYALNRRVELWLEGVTDPESITRELNELKE